MELAEQIKAAAKLILNADGLLITAGAGMYVDSGLSDIRDKERFGRAYPALRADGIGFQDISNADTFRRNPIRAWGFYGHLLNFYRHTVPHEGFDILRRWSSEKEHGAFVFTSNVDGQFQKAGFEEKRILECYGSIHRLQCSRACSPDVWSANDFNPEVDEEQCYLTSRLPRCPKCAAVARPNVLMFNDDNWNDYAIRRRRLRLEAWLANAERRVAIKLGACKVTPTDHNMSEQNGPRTLRIGTGGYAINPSKCVRINDSALDAIRQLNEIIG